MQHAQACCGQQPGHHIVIDPILSLKKLSLERTSFKIFIFNLLKHLG